LKLQIALHIYNALPFEATESLLLLAPRLTIDTEKQAYNDLLLEQLILLTSEQLNQYKTEIEESAVAEMTATETDVDIATATMLAEETIEELQVDTPEVAEQIFKEGWYALATLYQKNKFRPNLLIRQLNQWQEAYPDHATLQFMPLVLTNISELSPYQPENIALLLPLSGRYAQQSKAIQMGLLNAYYHQQKEAGVQKRAYMPKLHFFDTQDTDSARLVAQLKDADIDFVVGPLMKKEIETLLPLLENTPVLALNSFSEKIKSQNFDADIEVLSDTHIPWHYAFPLSPEDEAKQAAIMIYSDQHKKPLIIAPNSNYGIRVAQAFKEKWVQLTPSSNVQVEAYYFNSKEKYSSFIGDVLHTDKSKSRIRQMKAITHLALETEVRSRRDIDAIYIVSKRNELILLKPFIDVSVSPFAQQIPLYASSRSHSLDRNNIQNKELSGLVFSDNPFLLDPESELSKEVEEAWKKQSFSNLRLFSLGFDSYRLIEQLIYLQTNDDAVYKGLIGDLRLDSDNSIQAHLSWAKYQDGALIEITAPIPAE
jgi:outer membrane PBP1 activator LpoA protein